MALALTNKTIEKYFAFLSRLDTNSKKKLILKLSESIESPAENPFDLKSLYGAWEDKRDSDEIIREIKSSRIEKNDTPEL